MQVGEIMCRSVITVTPEDSAALAARLMLLEEWLACAACSTAWTAWATWS